MIPVFEPEIGSDEINAVVAALKRGEISGSFGSAIPDFEQAMASYCGCKYGVAVNSGTSALHLAIHAAGIGPGDEVLVSASTNVATALAVFHNGATIVPVDSESTTWNLDLDLLEELITPRTKAIMPVHLYGHPVDMDRLMAIAKKHNLMVIEDCAESHGATVRGRMTGSFGDMGCFSFYANKIITTGEGGMVVTNDKKLAEKVQLLRNMAFTEPRFCHQEAGYNFRMTGYQAAMGAVQVAKLDSIVSAKRNMAARYNQHLADIPGLQLPAEMKWAKNVYWMYAVVVEGKKFGINRDALAHSLSKQGIGSRTFFCPMNIQPCFEGTDRFRFVECPVAENIWKNGLYLPSSHTLTEEQIQTVAEAIKAACVSR